MRVLGPAAGETPLAGPKSPLGGPCLVVMRAPTGRGCNVAAAPPRVHNVIIDGVEKVVPVWGARSCNGAFGWRGRGVFESSWSRDSAFWPATAQATHARSRPRAHALWSLVDRTLVIRTINYMKIKGVGKREV